MEIFIEIVFVYIILTIIGVVFLAFNLKQKTVQDKKKAIICLKQVLETLSNNLKKTSRPHVSAAKNNKLPLMLFGVIFVLVSLIMSYFFAVNMKFTCSKIDNFCTIHETNIFGEKKQIAQINIMDLKAARIKEASSGRNTRPYNVILETTSGDMRLLKAYKLTKFESSGIANEINAFINSRQEKLEIKDSGKQTKNIGLFYAGVGLLFIFLSKRSS